MKKFLLRLSLYLLLLAGYSQLYAHAYAGCDNSSTKVSETLQNDIACSEQNSLEFIIKSASSDKQREVFKIDVTEVREEEEDEHESISFKKNLKSGNGFTAILGTQSLSYFFNKNISPDYRYPSYCSSHRYLIFQVFRI